MKIPTRFFFSVSLAMMIGVGHFGCSAQLAGAREKPPVRILFIGNSLTFVNDLPHMFQTLAATGNRKVAYGEWVYGGWTLQQHFENDGELAEIRDGDWDFVVLQEQSSTPVRNTEKFTTYARKFIKEIKKAGAVPILFENWETKGSNTALRLDSIYFPLAKQCGAEVAPFARAWKNVSGAYDFYKDYAHPTLQGQYLNACVLYGLLFQESPVGLSALDVPAKYADTLQRAAWRTILDTKNHAPRHSRVRATKQRLPDIAILDLLCNPPKPADGSQALLGALVKNIGNAPSPVGVIHGVAFRVDTAFTCWSDTCKSSLQPGDTVTLWANSGPNKTQFWTVTPGQHLLRAEFDDQHRMREFDKGNSKIEKTFPFADRR
jgi:hypothetical protein